MESKQTVCWCMFHAYACLLAMAFRPLCQVLKLMPTGRSSPCVGWTGVKKELMSMVPSMQLHSDMKSFLTEARELAFLVVLGVPM